MAFDDFHPFRTEYPTKDGRTVLLRPLTVDDADAFHEAMSQPRATWGTLQMPMTLPAKRRRLLEGNVDSPDNWMMGVELDGRIVGSGGVHMNSSHMRRRHAAGIGMSVHDEFQGIGLGTALMSAIIELSDEWLNIHRLELEVYTDNAPAIALYTRFGFEVEGTHRDDAFRGGRYVDTHSMARIRPAVG